MNDTTIPKPPPPSTRLTDHLFADRSARPGGKPGSPPLVGILAGTGIGPTVVGAALDVLEAVREALGFPCELRHGGEIGEDAYRRDGRWLPDEAVEFCTEVFRDGGAILNGPGGGRYVYDLRRRFDLFVKLVPVRPEPVLATAGRLDPRHVRDVDILLVRENSGGIYQGQWGDRATERGRVAEHSFTYGEDQVQRIVEVAARAARSRRGVLDVIVKDGGVPSITELWRDVGTAVARRHDLDPGFLNIDLAAYELIQNPHRFDVIVAPNLFGDVVADLAGVLVSSRGVTFSGNFDPRGHGVYQTNHGSAYDLAGRDVANPAGQIYSLAMMLRESFGLDEAASLVEAALVEVWNGGFRTADVAVPDCTVLGTEAMTAKVIEQVRRLAGRPAS